MESVPAGGRAPSAAAGDPAATSVSPQGLQGSSAPCPRGTGRVPPAWQGGSTTSPVAPASYSSERNELFAMARPLAGENNILSGRRRNWQERNLQNGGNL